MQRGWLGDEQDIDECEHLWNYSTPNCSGAVFPICIKCGYVNAPLYPSIGNTATNGRSWY